MTRDNKHRAGPLTQCDPLPSVVRMSGDGSGLLKGHIGPTADMAAVENRPFADGDNFPVAGKQAVPLDWVQPDELKILARCETLGLSLLKAIQLAVASDPADPYALLRLLDLDFSTYEPMQHRRPKRWLWMAARTSSVSYRGTLTETVLQDILTGSDVPDGFSAHFGHFLDEAPLHIVVMAVAEASQRSGVPVQEIWQNVARLAVRHSSYRGALWT